MSMAKPLNALALPVSDPKKREKQSTAVVNPRHLKVKVAD